MIWMECDWWVPQYRLSIRSSAVTRRPLRRTSQDHSSDQNRFCIAIIQGYTCLARPQIAEVQVLDLIHPESAGEVNAVAMAHSEAAGCFSGACEAGCLIKR